MKKLFFVGMLSVLMCSGCKWFGDKPYTDTGLTTGIDTLQLTQDTALTETPDSSDATTPAVSKETATTKPVK